MALIYFQGGVIDVKALHTRLEKNESVMASLETNVQKLKSNLGQFIILSLIIIFGDDNAQFCSQTVILLFP